MCRCFCLKIKFLILAFVIIINMQGVAYAHPDRGFLPDAVAEMEYNIVLELNPNDIETRNKLGIVLYRKNKLKEAEKEFFKVLKIYRNNFDAHDGMGLVKTKEKKYREAISWFKKAIAILDEDTMVHYHLGLVYEKLDNFIEAESSYKKALEMNNMFIQRDINRELELSNKDTLLSALKSLQDKIRHLKVGRR